MVEERDFTLAYIVFHLIAQVSSESRFSWNISMSLELDIS